MEDDDPAEKIIQLIQQAAVATAAIPALAAQALPPIVVMGNGNHVVVSLAGAHRPGGAVRSRSLRRRFLPSE